MRAFIIGGCGVLVIARAGIKAAGGNRGYRNTPSAASCVSMAARSISATPSTEDRTVTEKCDVDTH